MLEEACCWMHFRGHGGKEVNRVDQEEAEVVGWEVAAFIGILRCAWWWWCFLERGRGDYFVRRYDRFFFRRRVFFSLG